MYENAKTTTDPVFYNGNDPDLLVDPNQTIQQQKDRVMARFKQIRAANPQIQGNDEDFWAGWVNDAQQRFAKGINGANPSVTSAQLEALQAEQNILKSQSAVDRLDAGAIGGLIMNKDGLYEEQVAPSVSVKDYAATMATPADRPYNDVAEGMRMLGFEDKQPEVGAELRDALLKNKEATTKLKAEIASGNTYEPTAREKGLNYAREFASGVGETLNKATADAYLRRKLPDTSGMSDEQLKKLLTKEYEELKGTWKKGAGLGAGIADIVNLAGLQQFAPDVLISEGRKGVAKLTTREQKIANEAWSEVVAKTKTEDKLFNSTDPQDRLKALENQKTILETNLRKTEEKNTLQKQVAPRVALGDLVVGQMENTRPLTVSERKSQVSDFLTERFGAIDPTDPTGKKRIAVQGFDSFFQKAVPESEIKEFTTESGTRLIHINGKWEMMKSAEPKSLSDMRKDMVGIYGQQTKDGRLLPTELIPNSGIEIGGIFRGSDASEAQYNDEITQLSDARRSIKVLQEINDSVGEFADLTKAGIAEVEVMNLKSALRKDIIGVGTVSNFEQSLIDKVIRNPTDFFSMESKDRAILLALAQRIDRRIQNISAAKGLTVRIRDVNSANRYEALRQQYLKAKGIL